MGEIIEIQDQEKELEDSENFKEINMDLKDYEHTIGLKIKEKEVDAKNLMFLKEEAHQSISEIRNRIATGDYIVEYGFGDDKGLHHINVLKKELARRGLTVLLYEDDEEQESYLFDNLEESHRQTAYDVGLTDEDIDMLY